MLFGPAAATASTRIILPCPGFKVKLETLQLVWARSDAHVPSAEEVSVFQVCNERWDLPSLGLVQLGISPSTVKKFRA